MRKLHTINVLECIDGQIQTLTSFSDNKKGNLAAENIFMKMVQENQPEDRTQWAGIDYYIENGMYNNGNYYVYLIHSD